MSLMYNKIEYWLAAKPSCTLAETGEEVETASVTQKKESKGICMEGYPVKYHFVLFLCIHG